MTASDLPPRGRLVVLSGPSGVGKDTVLRAINQIAPGRLRRSVSYTTRAIRPGEVHGRDYHFVTRTAFSAMAERGEFLEWADVFGNLYGTSASAVETLRAAGDDVVLKIDVQGGLQVRDRVADAFLVFLMPPDRDELVRRLVTRGTEDPQSLARRRADATRELAAAPLYDHVVVNDDVTRAAARVLALVEGAVSA